MHILIMGAGRIGTAIAHAIKPNTTGIEFWDAKPGVVPDQKPLAGLASWADVIFLCVPSWSLREAIKLLGGAVKPTTIFVSLSKGIEEKTGKTIDVMLTEALPKNQPFALLIGPMLAAEIMEGKPTAGLLAAASDVSFKKLHALFHGSCIHVEHESDVRGVALASILKNIYAVGLGATQALGIGHNGQGWYISQGMREMRSIIEKLGGKGEIAHGLAGVGDLVATGLSPHSKNRTTGENFVKTGVCGTSEGCVALPVVWKELGKAVNEFPLLMTLHRMIVEGKNPKEELGAFFTH